MASELRGGSLHVQPAAIAELSGPLTTTLRRSLGQLSAFRDGGGKSAKPEIATRLADGALSNPDRSALFQP